MGVHWSAIGRRSVDYRVLLDFCLIVSFGWADNVIQMTDENSRISQHFNFFKPSLTTVVSHLHYPRNQSRYASRPLETSLHCNDVSHWLGAHLDWSLLSSIGNVDLYCVLKSLVMKSAPHMSCITHQAQARDDIDGLMQERHNSIANALGYVFLVLSHPYKECNFWVTTPPPYYLFQCNEINMIVFSIYVICSRQCPNGDGIYTLLYALYKFSTSITNQPTNQYDCGHIFYHWSMYWAYSIKLYCNATYREYRIGTVEFVIHNRFHHFQYLHCLHSLLKSSWRCPVTPR